MIDDPFWKIDLKMVESDGKLQFFTEIIKELQKTVRRYFVIFSIFVLFEARWFDKTCVVLEI